MTLSLKGVLHFFLISFLSTGLFIGCGKDLGTPAFLYFGQSQIVGNSSTLNSIPNGIYGIHLAINNQDRGSWEFPSLVPVLLEGNQNVVISPLVRVNTLSNNFIVYKMLELDTRSMLLTKGKTDTIIPVFKYAADIKPLLIQDFESSNSFSNSQIVFNQNQRSASLKIIANANTPDSSIEARHNQEIQLNPGSEIFLEFDYLMPSGILIPSLDYTDANGKTQRIFADNYIVPNPNQKWNRAYWRFSELVGIANVSKVYLTFSLLTQRGVSSAEAYIDNVMFIQR